MKIDPTNPRWLKQEKLGYKQGPHGILILSKGDCYTGTWKDDKKHGNGCHHMMKTNTLYEGGFQCDKRHGFGILSVPRYPVVNEKQSLFDEDKKECSSRKGKKVKEMKIEYAGMWKSGLKEGTGTAYYDDGSIFEGEFKDNLKNGWGKQVYQNGQIYEGEYHNDKKHGQGILIQRKNTLIELILFIENGDRYEGTWMNDMKEGPGKFIYLEKRQLLEGEWHLGIAVCGALIQFPNTSQVHAIPPIELVDYKQVIQDAKFAVQHQRELMILKI